MSFSVRILVGLAAGIAVGLFLGDLVEPLDVLANGFVKMLQMTVLPYVMISIVASLGSLSREEATRLGVRAGVVLAGLWALALLFALLMPLVFPTLKQGSFFSTSLLQQPATFDFVNLYIPSNPFNSLANNIVPAVVLFSIVLGVALIGIERKQVLLDVLAVLMDTMGRATRLIVNLTPYGMFAVAAVAAGTMQIEQVARIQVYLVAYVSMALLLAVWVLPGLVAALTPIRYRDILRPTRDAFLTAFVAGDLFIVLPALTEACRDLLARHIPARDDGLHASTLPDVIVPASFNFPHTGKVLSLSFVLFAGWFANATIPYTSYPALAFTGLLTFFGSLGAAVPFLLDMFRIPADTYQLFIATGVINQRVGSLLAAVHTVTIGLLGSAAIAGAVRLDVRRLTRYIVVTVCLVVGLLGSLRLLFETALRPSFDGTALITALKPVLPHAPLAGEATPMRQADAPVLAAVRAAQAVRVCYIDRRPPYAFTNREGALVGLDLEMAHQLAIDLQVALRLVPTSIDGYANALAQGTCDIAMGGIIATPQRATESSFSRPYMEETMAFVVPDHLRENYATWDWIRQRGDVRIGFPDVPYFRRQVERRLPAATLVPIDQATDLFASEWPYEALLLSAERGAFLTLLNPGHSVVVPTPNHHKVPVAYALPEHDDAWTSFVNAWLELHTRDGELSTLVDHWVFGKSFTPHPPRWSIIRDVLGWVE